MVRQPPKRRAMLKRRKRKAKMKKLRERYLQAKTAAEREAIIEKVLKINPFITKEQFLESLKTK